MPRSRGKNSTPCSTENCDIIYHMNNVNNEELLEAEEPKPPIVKIIAIVAVFFVVVLGIWYFSSGLRERIADENATSTPSTKKKNTEPELSFYNKWVRISSAAGAKESYPEKEYIEIGVVQPNLSGTDSTYWTLQNSRGDTVPLGPVSTLPLTGKVNAIGPLSLQAGDLLIVSTGRSPIGVSFRMNSCMLYLEQFQDFIPPITGQCPGVYDIEYGTDAYESLDYNCQTIIRSIPNCSANTRPLPPGTTASCKSFIESKMNYNACVAAHKNDFNFYLPEWRIFLGKDVELWDNSKETITLFDNKGKLIDALKY